MQIIQHDYKKFEIQIVPGEGYTKESELKISQELVSM